MGPYKYAWIATSGNLPISFLLAIIRTAILWMFGTFLFALCRYLVYRNWLVQSFHLLQCHLRMPGVYAIDRWCHLRSSRYFNLSIICFQPGKLYGKKFWLSRARCSFFLVDRNASSLHYQSGMVHPLRAILPEMS